LHSCGHNLQAVTARNLAPKTRQTSLRTHPRLLVDDYLASGHGFRCARDDRGVRQSVTESSPLPEVTEPSTSMMISFDFFPAVSWACFRLHSRSACLCVWRHDANI
ncbi:hypothetical protein BaRGS_00035620, partial [Batillaria attramentaria]